MMLPLFPRKGLDGDDDDDNDDEVDILELFSDEADEKADLSRIGDELEEVEITSLVVEDDDIFDLASNLDDGAHVVVLSPPFFFWCDFSYPSTAYVSYVPSLNDEIY